MRVATFGIRNVAFAIAVFYLQDGVDAAVRKRKAVDSNQKIVQRSENPNKSIAAQNEQVFWTRFIQYTTELSMPTLKPTPQPRPPPTSYPTPPITKPPTLAPTFSQTPPPQTSPPSPSPTEYPSTSTPSTTPSSAPVASTTAQPTSTPSGAPSTAPVALATASPSTSTPSESPSGAPVVSATTQPTTPPSDAPSNAPVMLATASPTSITLSPTQPTTVSPTSSPTLKPSNFVTSFPTLPPTTQISNAPSRSPVKPPTRSPSSLPSVSPSPPPTRNPTSTPTQEPSPKPTKLPTPAPTTPAPSATPSFSPTFLPTPVPTAKATPSPSGSPTGTPIALNSPAPSSATLAPNISPVAQSCDIVADIACQAVAGQTGNCTILQAPTSSQCLGNAPPSQLQMIYSGGDCSVSTTQDSEFSCSDLNGGVAGASQAFLTIVNQNIVLFQGVVKLGQLITASGKFGNSVNVTIQSVTGDGKAGDDLQALSFRTQCQDDNQLTLLTLYGALQLAGFSNAAQGSQSNFADIRITYTIKNNGTEPVQVSSATITSAFTGTQQVISSPTVVNTTTPFTRGEEARINLADSATVMFAFELEAQSGSTCVAFSSYSFTVG